MVKIQKSKIKSIQKDGVEKTLKSKMKKTGERSSKESLKTTGKTLKIAKVKVAKSIKQKSANLDGKLKVVGVKAIRANVTKKAIAVEVKESAGKNIKQKSANLDGKLKAVGVKAIRANVTKKAIAVEDKESAGKNMKQKSADLDRKLNAVHEKARRANITKKAIAVEVKESAGNNMKQKSADLDRKLKAVHENARKANMTKKAISEEIQESAGKIDQKNIPLTAKDVNKTKKADDKIKNNRKENQNQNSKEDTKKISLPIFEPANFDEEKFKNIVCLDNIKKICRALKVLVEKEVSKKKTSIFNDYKYFLNITSFKIPNCPKRMVKLKLEHSLVDTKRDDVVMIVPDMRRGAKVDYEPTIQHYQDLLREIEVENITIVPFNQLRNEYTSFESKRKFANTYDYFLCDGRIVGHTVGFCGKYFQKPRTTIHAVRLDKTKISKRDIEYALKRTSYRQLQRGDMISIPVGNHLFDLTQLAENIEVVIQQLKTIFPGGYANIRKMHIKIDIKGTSSLPLYVNLAGAPAEVPNVIGPREQKMFKLKKEANNILSKFSMSKSGSFVKLNKSQVKQKQEIRETRAALLSKENNEEDENNIESNPPLRKKIKKDEQKQEIREARRTLLSKENNEEDENNIESKPPLRKKIKKDEKYESQICSNSCESEHDGDNTNKEDSDKDDED